MLFAQLWLWAGLEPMNERVSPLDARIDDAKAGLALLRRLLLPKAAEDIPLLPSAEHTILVMLAALIGLYAGLAATLLRVTVRLCGAVFFAPGSILALLTDSESEAYKRLVQFLEGTNWRLELLVMGGIGLGASFAYGIYRQLLWRRQKRKRKISRAFLIGILLGVAVGMHYLLQLLSRIADAILPHQHGLLEMMEHTPLWALAAVACVGGTLVGFLTWWVPKARGHGVPDIMAGVALRGGTLDAKSGPWFAGAAALTVSSTGSVGLEGPVVFFGATTASGLGQALRLSRSRLRVLAAAGAAAGVAASFNAPIAGALFALEIIVGDFALATFSPVVIASIVGTVVHRSIEGDHPVFSNAQFVMHSGYEILLYVLLGLFCGMVGTLFVKILESSTGVGRLLERVPLILRPGVGLLVLVLVASLLGRMEILGSGHEAMRAIFEGKVMGLTLGILLIAKMVSTALTLSAGGIGGVMFPSLLIGASAGSLFGSAAGWFFGDKVASPQSYAIVGMGAVLTAVQQAPLTAAVMIFEFTNDYTIILPLMVSCILSTLLATRALGSNLYQRVLRRQGIFLSRGREQNILRSMQVEDSMRKDFVAVPEGTRLGELARIIAGTLFTTFPLMNAQEELVGVLSLQDLRQVMFEPGLNDLIVAGELGTRKVATIFPEDNLATALSRFALQPFEHLVVVSSKDRSRVVGLLGRQDTMSAYQAGLRQAGVLDVSAEFERAPSQASPG